MTGPGTLAGQVVHLTLRRVKGVKKQALRGVKRARHLVRRSRSAAKSLFFNLRDTDTGRTVLKAVLLARAPRERRQRVQAAAPYIARIGRSSGVDVDRAKGYGLIRPEAMSDFGAVLALSRQLFERKKAEIDARLAGFDTWNAKKQEKYRSGKQSFLQYLLDDDDLRQHPALVDFALHDLTLGTATKYLGLVPYLTRIDLMYSIPRSSEEKIESQLFHLDHEGLTQAKIFLHLFDVGDAEGPFTFIPADATARIVRDVRALRRQRRTGGDVEARRYSDEEIDAVGGRREIVTVTGPAGAGVAVDTSRCLHLGSRVSPGTFRLCLYLQYCTTLELTNVYAVDRLKNDPVRYLAVKHSVEPGRRRATDYTHEMRALGDS